MRSPLVLRAARAIGALTRLAGRGGGTALPGLLVEEAAPDLISDLAGRLSDGVVLVTGTNGKTTTCGLLASLLAAAGYRVVHNRAGSNLMRGIASALVQAPGLEGDGKARTIGLFEVDEATLPEAVHRLAPHLVVVLNLFRDQLDRYGEVDTVAARWREAVAALPPSARVILNADDPLVASLGAKSAGGEVMDTLFFGLQDTSQALPAREHAADFVECSRCAVPYEYSATFYGHIGHYRCPQCGWQRPQPQVTAISAEVRGLDGSRLRIAAGDEEVTVETKLPGLYNACNLLGAAAAAWSLGVPLASLPAAALAFRPAFGRAERFRVNGKPVVLLLTKNPVGTNQVLRALLADPAPKPLLVALNDYFADGEDISWVWDADYEALKGHLKWAVATGHRATDMAVRLKYAGLFEGPGAPASRPVVIPHLEQALRTGVYRLAPGETLYVLATYTAMLELREVLSRMGVLRPFWEETA